MEGALKDLLNQLVTAKHDHDTKLQQTNTKIEDLLQAIKAPPAVDAAALRKDQVLKITQNFNKAKRLKPYKVTHDIKLFLKMFDEEIINARASVGLNEELKKAEWVPIFRACLDFAVVDRVKVILLGKKKTWEDIEIKDLKDIMTE